MGRLIELIRYPLKSGQGTPLDGAELGRRGLAGDRRWMVVNPNGDFMTGRKHPAIIGLKAQPLSGGRIRLEGRDGSHHIAAPALGQPCRDVVVWGTQTRGQRHEPSTNAWLTKQLGTPCELVFMPDTVERPVGRATKGSFDIVSYADGFPLLLTSQSSLDDLNERLAIPIEMRRFRPNLVIEGLPPFTELQWHRIRMGEVEFESGGPCVRCTFTTRDPITGERRTDGEPLKTLSSYQRTEDGVVFGVNFIPRSLGRLALGDEVEIISV